MLMIIILIYNTPNCRPVQYPYQSENEGKYETANVDQSRRFPVLLRG